MNDLRKTLYEQQRKLNRSMILGLCCMACCGFLAKVFYTLANTLHLTGISYSTVAPPYYGENEVMRSAVMLVYWALLELPLCIPAIWHISFRSRGEAGLAVLGKEEKYMTKEVVADYTSISSTKGWKRKMLLAKLWLRKQPRFLIGQITTAVLVLAITVYAVFVAWYADSAYRLQTAIQSASVVLLLTYGLRVLLSENYGWKRYILLHGGGAEGCIGSQCSSDSNYTEDTFQKTRKQVKELDVSISQKFHGLFAVFLCGHVAVLGIVNGLGLLLENTSIYFPVSPTVILYDSVCLVVAYCIVKLGDSLVNEIKLLRLITKETLADAEVHPENYQATNVNTETLQKRGGKPGSLTAYVLVLLMLLYVALKNLVINPFWGCIAVGVAWYGWQMISIRRDKRKKTVSRLLRMESYEEVSTQETKKAQCDFLRRYLPVVTCGIAVILFIVLMASNIPVGAASENKVPIVYVGND